MEIELTRGCISDSMTIDDISEVSMTDEQRKVYWDKICDFMKKNPKLSEFNYFLQWFIPAYGEYECNDQPCDCCGDYVEKFRYDCKKE